MQLLDEKQTTVYKRALDVSYNLKLQVSIASYLQGDVRCFELVLGVRLLHPCCTLQHCTASYPRAQQLHV